MAEVVKGIVGAGFLGAGQTIWWNWQITAGDAWYFWVDAAQMGIYTTTKMEILRVLSYREGFTSRAYIQLHNPGSLGTTFYLRVVRVI